MILVFSLGKIYLKEIKEFFLFQKTSEILLIYQPLISIKTIATQKEMILLQSYTKIQLYGKVGSCGQIIHFN